jgi:D-alanyl-D-alanine carboxypeptidase
MGVIGTAGKIATKNALGKDGKTGSDETTSELKPTITKDALKNAFPNAYAGNKFRTATKDKQSPVTNSVTGLAGAVAETNSILTTSIEVQSQQNAILSEILKAIKDGGLNGGGFDLSDLLDIGKSKGKPKARAKAKAAKAAGRRGLGKSFKGPSVVKGAAKTAGKFAGKAIPGLNALVAGYEGYEEYQESGKVGRAASVAGGSLAGGAAGAAAGAAIGSAFFGIGAIPGALIGSALGSYLGGEAGRSGYDMLSGEGKKGEGSDLESDIITYRADDIVYTAKEMVIQATVLHIKGDEATGTSITGPGGNKGTASGIFSPGGSTGTGTDAGTARSNGPAGIVSTNGDMTKLRTSGGREFTVATEYAQNFLGFVTELEASGYQINSIGGYANRTTAAGGFSWHARGMAIDINPSRNPHTFPNMPNYGQTDMPMNVGEMAAKYGLGWGGNWSSSKDTMHFSAGPPERGNLAINAGRNQQNGNIQVAAAGQPQTPAYAEGTNYVPKTGNATVGERGKEMLVRNGKGKIIGGGTHTEVLQQGDQVVPTNAVGAFFNELVSPVTGKETKQSDLIQKVVGGRGEVSDVGTAAAKGVKNLSPVDLDRVGDVGRSMLKGDVGGVAENIVRAAPFGGLVADTFKSIVPQDNVKPAPAAEPPSRPVRPSGPPQTAGGPRGGASKAAAAPGNKEKRADAGDTNSINMLKTMFAN